MRLIFDFISLLRLMRRLSSEKILCIIARNLTKTHIYFLSFIFAPIKTISFLVRAKSHIKLDRAFKKLGPIFIKFGQTLSTRPDLIGAEISESLKSLQDSLDPFTTKEVNNILSRDLGERFNDIFSLFDYTPVAAASIAQVHKAQLKNGQDVAVKILRPNIGRFYKKDINLLYSLARIGNLILSKAKQLKLIEAVKIFEESMKFELNLVNEASACSQIYDNMADDENIVIPKVYWDYTTKNILVLEWIDGVSIYNSKDIEELNLSKKEITKKLAISFLNQSFRDGFFHADLHPGNILVRKDGKIAFIDFGIIGKLSDRDRIAMAEVLYCLLNKNYKRVAEIHVEIGFIPKDTDIVGFALACRAATEPIIGKPTNDISIGHLVENLFKIISDFGMQTQPQLILLQKNILLVEGIGKILAPEVNMWNLAEPWVKKWASKNLTYDAKIIKFIQQSIKKIAKTM